MVVPKTTPIAAVINDTLMEFANAGRSSVMALVKPSEVKLPSLAMNALRMTPTVGNNKNRPRKARNGTRPSHAHPRRSRDAGGVPALLGLIDSR